MTKPKFRTAMEICADCNAPDPAWASVNRGVYMCNECAGVHRNLGRHVSQVKHLHRSFWHQNQKNMVHQLVVFGANSVWEHSLLDPAQVRSGKRKPNPSDPVHSTKNDFIRAKYEQLAFVHRPSRQTDEDLGKQLHSSVRTANLDTSLRLLSFGAQANFFHPERGNTPLHVAAKAGQVLQVELLVTYGADPACLDTNRQTPEDVARTEGLNDLADRLVELKYELSDKLSNFIWGTKPDHKMKNHYTLLKSKDNGVGQDGRKRLQALSNQIFEELAMDAYDEVDRRETEKIWQELKQSGGKMTPTADHVAVPFLTVNPEYSTTRNQGRQKLARFTAQEFSSLISDILHDIVRRQSACDGSFNINQPTMNSTATKEDPIYDLPPDGNLDYQSIEKSAVLPYVTAQPVSVPLNEFVLLKQKLQESEEKCTKLQEQNRDLSNKVTMLAKQNHELQKQKQQVNQYSSAFKPTDRKSCTSKTTNLGQFSPRSGSSSSLNRPTSVYNPTDSCENQSSLASVDSREQRRKTIHETQHGILSNDEDAESVSSSNQTAESSKFQKPPHLREQTHHNSVGSDYDNHVTASTGAIDVDGKKEHSDTANSKLSVKNVSMDTPNTNENNNILQEKPASSDSSTPSGGAAFDIREVDEKKDSDASHGVKSLPKADEVIRKTETVTRNIQNLLQAAQKCRIESYLNCSENILVAVNEIIALFPEKPDDAGISSVIKKLGAGAEKLRNRCRVVADQDQGAAVNSKQVTEEIIKNAYEIAKAEKELVTMTTKQQSEDSAQSSI